MGVDEYGPAGTIEGLRAVTHDQVYLGETSIFAARVTSGTHITYDWDFGDGNIASGGVASHTYNSPGVYQVVLTATNTLGSEQASTLVTVSEVLAADPGGSSTTTDGMLTFEIPAAFTSTVTITYTPQTTTSLSIVHSQKTLSNRKFHRPGTREQSVVAGQQCARKQHN